MADKYGVHIKTIQRRLDSVKIEPTLRTKQQSVLIADTTYFGRNFWVMVFMDADSKDVLHHQFVKWESLALYQKGITVIEQRNIKISALVCDGKRGLLKSSSDFPIQMCHFHQVSIVTRYITRKPRMQATIELKAIIHLLSKTDKESFEGMISQWYSKWQSFLNERRTDTTTGKSRYIHRRLRSAYRSICYNLPWLYTFYDHPTLQIPNTTNQLEGLFTDLKNKLRNHNGLSRARKEKFIAEFFRNRQ